MYPVGITNPTQGQAVWVHEFSHHFGIGHSGKCTDGNNENPFSAMAHVGREVAPYGGVACEHIAYHKRIAGWLDATRVHKLTFP